MRRAEPEGRAHRILGAIAGDVEEARPPLALGQAALPNEVLLGVAGDLSEGNARISIIMSYIPALSKVDTGVEDTCAGKRAEALSHLRRRARRHIVPADAAPVALHRHS